MLCGVVRTASITGHDTPVRRVLAAGDPLGMAAPLRVQRPALPTRALS